MFDTGRDIAVTAVERGNSSKSADQGRCGMRAIYCGNGIAGVR